MDAVLRQKLDSLIQALELQLKIDQSKTLADTHLNLCAVLSQLDRHEDALQHVMLSIILIQDQFLQTTLWKARESRQVQVSDERLAVLAIAYHNLGVQFQHLKRFEQSVKIHKKALQICKDFLSENEQLIQNLAKVVKSATQQIQDQKQAFLDNRKHKYERDASQSKKQIYNDFARQVDRLKNLPKLKIKEATNVTNIRSSVEPITRNQKSFSRDVDRGFATRKHPRYYKSYALTPSNDDNSLAADVTSQGESIIQNRVIVSEDLQDFSVK